MGILLQPAERARKLVRIFREDPLGVPAWRVLLVTCIGLPVVSIALRMFGLGRLLERLRSVAAGSADKDAALDEILRWGFLVNAAARHLPFTSSCLVRSLFLDWLLRRHGFRSRVRIGVRRPNGGALDGHAWVEWRGIPVNDLPDIADQFATLSP